MKYTTYATLEYKHGDGWKYAVDPDPETEGEYIRFRYFEWDRPTKSWVQKTNPNTVPREVLVHVAENIHLLKTDEIGND